MSNFAVGNVLLLLSILATSSAQVVIKMVLSGIPPRTPPGSMLLMMLSAARIWQVGLFLLLLACGFVFWILSLSKLPLSYAYALACSSALIVALLSVAFLREPVTWRLWVGAVLISVGSAFIVAKG